MKTSGQQGQVAMDCAHREARPARRAPASSRQHAEGDRRGQQQQSDDARAAGQVPERLRVAARRRSSGHRLGGPAADDFDVAARADETRRQLPLLEPAGRRVQSTIEAVAATLASTQVAAATVAVRQQLSRRPTGRGVEHVMRVARSRCAIAERSCSMSRGRRTRSTRRGQGRRAAPHGRRRFGSARPAASGDCDVATERDEHAAAGLLGDRAGGVIGRPCLGGRAEVEFDTARYPQRQPAACRARRDAIARRGTGRSANDHVSRSRTSANVRS